MKTGPQTDPPPTPYREINQVLGDLLEGQQAVLGSRLVGLYLHGSLAAGGFNPLRSDIDFLAVTRHKLPDRLMPALERMHARLTQSGQKWAAHMEGSYIPLKALRRYDPANATHPVLRVDGSFGVEGHSIDWVIQRHTLREHGLALHGPDIQDLIEPISPEELRGSAAGILKAWWEPQLTDHKNLLSREYQAYAALTMCRSFYTLKYGTIVPKDQAAAWAMENLEPAWSPLIEQALSWPNEPQPDRLAETLDFVRYTLAICRGEAQAPSY